MVFPFAFFLFFKVFLSQTFKLCDYRLLIFDVFTIYNINYLQIFIESNTYYIG